MSGVDPAQMFRQEAADLLERLEADLLSLEHAPGNQELVDGVFRAMHTLKGSGAMFGYDRVAGFTHHLETAFDRVRRGEAIASSALIQLTLGARDHIRRLIEQPEQADDATGTAILAELDIVLAAAGAPAGEPAVPPASVWHLHIGLPTEAMANGLNPLLLLDELRALGECEVVALTDAIPPLETLRPTDCHVSWRVTLTTTSPRSAIDEVFLFVPDGATISIEPAVAGGPASAPPEPLPTPEAPANSAGAAEPPRADARSRESVRVPAERLDELMDRVGELVITQSRLRQVAATSGDPQVKAIAEEIERLALELRDTTMGMRMVPIVQLFSRFRRLVRDLSVELGKEIELTMVGEDTELDKTMIERLNDPLIHLIRNSVDHGLEPPDARLAKGKSRSGRITLTARHAGQSVLVSVSDDGRGLDRTRIQARAEERGLLPAGAKLGNAELFQVLFQPGFSTAREVTHLSGRGVGLDVVKRTIEAMRGSIDIDSTATGSTFTMRLPLTLAIIDGLLVRVGRGRYVIPLSAVEECVELTAAEDARASGRSFLNIRGSLVPYLRLRELFGTVAPVELYQKIVIVSAGDLRVGLVVDQVIGDHQTVIKSLSRLHDSIGTFSGATILGDGTVALILEVPHLVGAGQVREERLKAAS